MKRLGLMGEILLMKASLARWSKVCATESVSDRVSMAALCTPYGTRGADVYVPLKEQRYSSGVLHFWCLISYKKMMCGSRVEYFRKRSS